MQSEAVQPQQHATYHVYSNEPNTNELQPQTNGNPGGPNPVGVGGGPIQTQVTQVTQVTQQQQQAPSQNQISAPQKQPENSCSLGIDNSGTDSATISIKLPPSVLQDQKQLSTIVNTISKALHQPSAAATESSAVSETSAANATAELSAAQQTYNMKTSAELNPDPNLIANNAQNWQQQATSNQSTYTLESNSNLNSNSTVNPENDWSKPNTTTVSYTHLTLPTTPYV